MTDTANKPKRSQAFLERFIKNGAAGQNLNRVLRYARMLRQEKRA